MALASKYLRLPSQHGETSTKNNHIYLLLCPRQIQRSSFLFREFSSLVLPVSKSFVRAMTLPNPLAMQIKPCISSKTFQSVPNSRSQDLPKFTASNLTSYDLCQNLLPWFIPHNVIFLYKPNLWMKSSPQKNLYKFSSKCANSPLICANIPLTCIIFLIKCTISLVAKSFPISVPKSFPK